MMARLEERRVLELKSLVAAVAASLGELHGVTLQRSQHKRGDQIALFLIDFVTAKTSNALAMNSAYYRS